MIVAAHAEAKQEGQIPNGAEIEFDIGKVRPRHSPDDHEIAAAVVLERGEELAHLTPFQPGVGVKRDLVVGFAADAENVHGTALGQRSIGERSRKRASAGDDGEWAIAVGGIRLLELSFGPALGHCCSAHRMSDRNEI